MKITASKKFRLTLSEHEAEDVRDRLSTLWQSGVFDKHSPLGELLIVLQEETQ